MRVALPVGWFRERWLWAAGVLALGWPSCRWFVARLGDGGDEPWGLLALAGAVAVAVAGERRPLGNWQMAAGAGLALLSRAELVGSTSLIAASLVAVGLWAVLLERRVWVGQLGLFLLALPLIASLQFYAGYPLRALVGEAGALILRGLGQAVEAEGTTLLWRGEQVAIDAPCSGLRMLWSSACVACGLIALLCLDTRRALRLLQFTGLAALVANVARNVALFYVETGLVEVGDWAHDGVGLAVFGADLGLVAWRANALAGGGSGSRWTWAMGALAAGAACWAALALRTGPRPEEAAWAMEDSSLRAEGWQPLALDERTRGYAEGFAGELGVYERGGATLTLRSVGVATRRLHPAADCYRAWGFRIQELPLVRDGAGRHWSRFAAERDGVALEVRERISDGEGGSWTDHSSWYWAAALGRTRGPWQAVTVAEPVAVASPQVFARAALR